MTAKKNYLTILLFVIVFSTNAQDGVFQGMGNASVMLFDFWSNFSNQAGLAKVEIPTIGVCYHNGFLINETGTQAVGGVLPTKTGNFNLNFSRYGYSLFSENTFGLGYSRKINNKLSAGIQFDYFYLGQSEAYKNKSLFLFELGFIASPADKLQIGVHVFNPTRAKISDYQNERVATILRLGLGYHFTDGVLFTVEAEKDMDKKVRIKSGFAYRVIDMLTLYAGVGTNPNAFSFGLGYQLKSLNINLAFTTHPSLPVSTQGALSYAFN